MDRNWVSLMAILFCRTFLNIYFCFLFIGKYKFVKFNMFFRGNLAFIKGGLGILAVLGQNATGSVSVVEEGGD